MSASLAELIGKPTPGRDLRLRQALVTSVPVGGVCTIRFGDLASTTTADDIAGVSSLTTASISNGDAVWVVQTGGVLLVVGRIGGSLGIQAAPQGDLSSGAAEALSKTAAESIRYTTTAIQTFANRRYKITGYQSTSGGGAWVYALLQIRRGTTLGGTLLSRMYYPRTSWQTMKVEGFDVPGAQAAQQWVLTHQLDASVCDLYGASGIWVEDVGPV
jgi:hypothetical protein